MLLLSLGPEAISALLWHGPSPRFVGPDLAWLVFGPDLVSVPADNIASEADMRYDVGKNALPINPVTG